MKSTPYERLLQLNRCMEQVAEILEQFRQDGTIHAIYASSRTRAVEELRADLSYVVAGMLSQKEFAACAGRGPRDDHESGKKTSTTETRRHGEDRERSAADRAEKRR